MSYTVHFLIKIYRIIHIKKYREHNVPKNTQNFDFSYP